MSSELSLTWDDHHSTLVGVFEKLLETSTLVDCTIAAEGQYLKAHKIILSACSPYFELLFSQENEKNPIVVLKDIKFQELKAMIEFIYRGKVKVPEERLGDFVDAAESLQIKGLGSDSHQKMSPQYSGNEGLYTQRRRGRSSPQPRKRMRHADFCESLSRSSASPTNVESLENKSVEGLSHGIPVEASTSCQSETNLSLSSATNSPTSLPPNVCSELRNLETTECVPFVKTPSSPCEEVHLNPETIVVKSEPETLADVYVPEIDCYIEPKEEQIIQEVALERTGEDTNAELATNQYPAFSPVPQISTRPEPVFVPEAVETTNSLGLVSRAEDNGGRGSPGTWGSSGPRVDRAPGPPAGTTLPPPRRRGQKKPLRCQQCDKAFRRATDLTCHMRNHTGERPFVCEVCGKAFSVKGVLKKHLNIHTGERPFACELCGKAFSVKDVLKKHLRIHTGDRPFTCEQCGKPFSAKFNLETHLRIHTGERPFVCEVCGKAFSFKGALKEHLRSHTGERPFVCEVCGKAFTVKYSLKEHLRSHTGDRPFACEVCNKAFSVKGVLKKHLLIHTGDRPFACELCDKAFNVKGNLKKHLRIHTG